MREFVPFEGCLTNDNLPSLGDFCSRISSPFYVDGVKSQLHPKQWDVFDGRQWN